MGIDNQIDDLRKEYLSNKRKYKNQTDLKKVFCFWCTDIHDLYEKLKDYNLLNEDTPKYMVDITPKYGNDMYSICKLYISGKDLPKMLVKGVPENILSLMNCQKTLHED